MCAEVVQGYGLTETMAGAHVSLPNSKGGNVGPPLPGVQLRLESCKELGYDATVYPPKGEVRDMTSATMRLVAPDSPDVDHGSGGGGGGSDNDDGHPD